jgi:imidazole glycerol-phosphate synthase subunit HisF
MIIRIIPVLFIKNGLIVRSQLFKRHQIIGNVVSQAKRLNDWNADELVYIDISRENIYDSRRDDVKIKSMSNITEMIKSISKVCFMPLTFGGGIRSLVDALTFIRSGADKIVINHLLFEAPDIVLTIVESLGSQAVVASIDYKNEAGMPIVYKHYGTESTGISVYTAMKMAIDFGIGELFIQNIDADGMAKGYDLETINNIVYAANIPVIVCSGAGNSNHFLEAATIQGISGIAAGNYFNFKERSYPILKNEMKKRGLNVR